MADIRNTAAAAAQDAALQSQKGGGQESALADFGRSLVYSALERPVNGVLEAYDHATGSHAVESATWLAAPEQAKPFSTRWQAQVFGSALGSLFPVAMTYLAVHKLGGDVLESGEARGVLPRLVGTDASALNIARMGATGVLLEGAFNPIGDNHQNYWATRAALGLGGGAIFAGFATLASLPELRAGSTAGAEVAPPLPGSAAGAEVAPPLPSSAVRADVAAVEMPSPPLPPEEPLGTAGDTTLRARQIVDESAPAQTYSIHDVLAGSPDLEGHATAFTIMRQQFPDDFRGLRSASLDPLSHGGDSLTIDLAPANLVDDSGNMYSRGVLKILEAPEQPRPGEGWQTPEWQSEWGRRDPIDLPLLRTEREAATTEPKEINVGGRRYYAFMQPKGLAETDEFGDQSFVKLEQDPAYVQWEKDLQDGGYEWIDKKPGQVVKYSMLEPHPETGAPQVVHKYGLADYPSVGNAGAEAMQPLGLSERGMHIMESPAPDPQWAELQQTVQDYKDSGVPRAQIEQTVGILYEDLLKSGNLTARQAVQQALRPGGLGS